MKIRVCTYDSPMMRRECWENGELIYAIDCSLMFAKGFSGPIFFGANIGKWKTGQIVGDPEAMNKQKEATTEQSSADHLRDVTKKIKETK